MTTLAVLLAYLASEHLLITKCNLRQLHRNPSPRFVDCAGHDLIAPGDSPQRNIGRKLSARVSNATGPIKSHASRAAKLDWSSRDGIALLVIHLHNHRLRQSCADGRHLFPATGLDDGRAECGGRR